MVIIVIIISNEKIIIKIDSECMRNLLYRPIIHSHIINNTNNNLCEQWPLLSTPRALFWQQLLKIMYQACIVLRHYGNNSLS